MCTNPLRGWLVFNDYVDKVTKSDVLAVRFDGEKIVNIYSENYIDDRCSTRYIDIPCRSCLECYEQSRREWIARAVAEAQCHDKMLFVTLTYNDELVPTVEHIDDETGEISKRQTLRYRDFQLFMKRLRKKIDSPLRFMVCGEYGSRTYRPHYHAIFYGLSLSDIPDAIPHSKSKTGDFLYSSKWLDNAWSNGYILIADANTATIAYVAGYVAKKADTVEAKSFYEYFNITRPFIRSSLRPALGEEWFRKNIFSFGSRYDYCSVPTSDEPVKIFLTSSWKRKYDDILYREVGFDIYHEYDKSKQARRSLLFDDYYQHLDTDMSKADYNYSLNLNFRKSSKRKRGVY